MKIAYFKCPMNSTTPHTMSIETSGKVEINPPIKIGFLHYGLISKCDLCGEIVDIDEKTTDLPIQYPDGDIQIKSNRSVNERKSIIQKRT